MLAMAIEEGTNFCLNVSYPLMFKRFLSIYVFRAFQIFPDLMLQSMKK